MRPPFLERHRGAIGFSSVTLLGLSAYLLVGFPPIHHPSLAEVRSLPTLSATPYTLTFVDANPNPTPVANTHVAILTPNALPPQPVSPLAALSEPFSTGLITLGLAGLTLRKLKCSPYTAAYRRHV